MKLRAHAHSLTPHDFTPEMNELRTSASSIVNEASAPDPTKPKEIKRRHVTLVEEIGTGQFGNVWKAKINAAAVNVPGGITVAAKVLREPTEESTKDLFSEAAVAAQLGDHDHVVGLLGVVTAGLPAMLLVSFCEHGSLLSQLKRRLAQLDPFSTQVKFKFAQQICQGMEYLAKKHFVHRDLAARNVLIDVDWKAKISDFGLSRETQASDDSEYYRSNSGMYPVRWTSPEAMQSQKYTQASDVWSFGIVCVEIFQDGATPYGDLTLEGVIYFVGKGDRIQREDIGCSERVYQLLLLCWNAVPEDRPTFDQLLVKLGDLLKRQHDAAVPMHHGQNRRAALGLLGNRSNNGAAQGVFFLFNI